MAKIKIGNIKGPVGPQGKTGATGPVGPIGPAGPLPPLADNFTTTQAGVAALDAAAGKRLHEGFNQLNSDIQSAKSDFAADIAEKLDKGMVIFDGVGKVAFAQSSTATSIRMYTTDVNYLYVEFLTATKNIKFGFYDGATWTDYWIM